VSYLRLHNIVKTFGQSKIVKHLSLDIEKGEFISFLGPSGCGKTTTLNMIAGFLALDEGAIEVEGKPVHNLPPHKRSMGMVFQNYALFPHMTVYDNVAYGLKLRKVPRDQIRQRVQSALEMTRLEALRDRFPKQLSGGQQQRVAISRALVIEPTVLLLDEPLSNLDARLRQEMREEISLIQKQVGITTIFVTHDQEEALSISDRIAVMNEGRIEQVDTPEKIYNQPKTSFVASFIGEVNRLSGEIVCTTEQECTVHVYGNTLQLPLPPEPAGKGPATFYIRPERMRISRVKPDAYPAVAATLARKVFLGAKMRYVLQVRDQQIVAEASDSPFGISDLLIDEQVYVYWEPKDLLLAGSGV
jgi:iron(III) transport system ATP-binding protein/putative spermidine/putrescine transport system ATP-binding protein